MATQAGGERFDSSPYGARQQSLTELLDGPGAFYRGDKSLYRPDEPAAGPGYPRDDEAYRFGEAYWDSLSGRFWECARACDERKAASGVDRNDALVAFIETAKSAFVRETIERRVLPLPRGYDETKDRLEDYARSRFDGILEEGIRDGAKGREMFEALFRPERKQTREPPRRIPAREPPRRIPAREPPESKGAEVYRPLLRANGPPASRRPPAVAQNRYNHLKGGADVESVECPICMDDIDLTGESPPLIFMRKNPFELCKGIEDGKGADEYNIYHCECLQRSMIKSDVDPVNRSITLDDSVINTICPPAPEPDPAHLSETDILRRQIRALQRQVGDGNDNLIRGHNIVLLQAIRETQARLDELELEQQRFPEFFELSDEDLDIIRTYFRPEFPLQEHYPRSLNFSGRGDMLAKTRGEYAYVDSRTGRHAGIKRFYVRAAAEFSGDDLEAWGHVLIYSNACAELGYHHSVLSPGALRYAGSFVSTLGFLLGFGIPNYVINRMRKSGYLAAAMRRAKSLTWGVRLPSIMHIKHMLMLTRGARDVPGDAFRGGDYTEEKRNTMSAYLNCYTVPYSSLSRDPRPADFSPHYAYASLDNALTDLDFRVRGSPYFCRARHSYQVCALLYACKPVANSIFRKLLRFAADLTIGDDALDEEDALRVAADRLQPSERDRVLDLVDLLRAHAADGERSESGYDYPTPLSDGAELSRRFFEYKGLGEGLGGSGELEGGSGPGGRAFASVPRIAAAVIAAAAAALALAL